MLRRRTGRMGRCEYRVDLPGQPDAEHVEAKIHDGVLTVRVPAEGSRRRRKDVKGGPSVSAVAQRRQPEPWAWRRSGQSLVRELAFRDFDQAIAFVEQLASVAENHLHRPNM